MSQDIKITSQAEAIDALGRLYGKWISQEVFSPEDIERMLGGHTPEDRALSGGIVDTLLRQCTQRRDLKTQLETSREKDDIDPLQQASIIKAAADFLGINYDRTIIPTFEMPTPFGS